MTALQDWILCLAEVDAPIFEKQLIYQALTEAYDTAERPYHNLEHVGEMRQIIAQLEHYIQNRFGVEMAVWFHDLILEPGATDNEERSAAAAVGQLAKLGVGPDTCQEIASLILRTKTHTVSESEWESGNWDAAVLIAADLAILGAPSSRYQRYASAIRKEYAHVSETDYRIGRAKVLLDFLGRPTLFYFPELRPLEEQAWINLNWELRLLGGV
jgi:predicted metal-dependent HD superfamily phosphohydrolase